MDKGEKEVRSVTGVESRNMNSAVALAAHGLSCVRGGRLIFAELNFTVAAGSVLLLRGANGSGKSSLLQVLAGVLPMESGDVSSFGNAVRSEHYLRNMRYVGHGNGIKQQLTAIENLAFYRKFRGWNNILPEDALQQASLTPQAGIVAGSLSAGQQRRLALTRLLLTPALLWLLDEPCTALDQKAGSWFATVLQTHCSAGGAAVIAQHGDVGSITAPVTELVLAG